MKQTAVICEFIGGPLDGLLTHVRPFVDTNGREGITIEFPRPFQHEYEAIWVARQPLGRYCPDFEMRRCVWNGTNGKSA